MHTPIRVMFVDDSHSDRKLFEEALSKIDPSIQYISVETGYAALSYLTLDLGPKPDYIFMDINMPGMSGLECLSEIKKHSVLVKIPVIMFTSAQVFTYMDAAKLLGASQCHSKSSTFEGNCDIIASVLFGAKQTELK
jgi:CheY-like chemotaxis protein